GEHGAAAAAHGAALGAVRLEGEVADDEHARAVGHEVGAGRGVHAPLIGGARRAVRLFFWPRKPTKTGVRALFCPRPLARPRGVIILPSPTRWSGGREGDETMAFFKIMSGTHSR